MSILHLTLKKHWFDMIASGEKKEEYRELKPYWYSRLMKAYPPSVIAGGDIRDRHSGIQMDFRTYDYVLFKNGYGKDAPTMKVECKGIKIGGGYGTWGAEPFEEYFIIKLGNIVGWNNMDL